MRSLLWIVTLGSLLLAASCREERKVDVLAGLNPKKMPTMKTVGVNTVISDSGITKYKIVSPVWYVYDELDTPVWRFPKGVYLEQFDRNMKVEGSVACDSAIYYKSLGLWRLDGHVEMRNTRKDLFMTQQLFWDQQRHKLYSDSFIHIERTDRVLEGHGFESNERLTTYRINRPTGIFPAHLGRGPGEMPTPAGAATPPPGASGPVPPSPQDRNNR